MNPTRSISARAALAASALAGVQAAHAVPEAVTVTVQSLVPANSIAFARLHLGFGNGTYDAFNIGQAAGTGIVSVAEGGLGTTWQANFAAAEPLATRGTIGAGQLLPGQTQTATFTVDPAVNSYFTFAAMVVPSNDFFIGNDSPTQYKLLNSTGTLLVDSITLKANQIWDAGSEIFDPAAAAFVGNNDLRTPQNSVVALNFAEFAAYNGLTTGAGYVFNSGLAANTDVYRISFAVAAVPEPQTAAMWAAGLVALGALARRRLGRPAGDEGSMRH